MSLKIFPPLTSYMFDDVIVSVDAPLLILLVASKKARWLAGLLYAYGAAILDFSVFDDRFPNCLILLLFADGLR